MAENQNSPGHGAPPGMPGWVKFFFLVILLLIVIVIVVHLAGLRFDHGAGVTSLAGLIGAPNPLQDRLL